MPPVFVRPREGPTRHAVTGLEVGAASRGKFMYSKGRQRLLTELFVRLRQVLGGRGYFANAGSA